MNLTLTRIGSCENGVFGFIKELNLVTLEHAYALSRLISPFYSAKLPVGQYICEKGLHRLEGMTQDFTTFEVTGVPDHTGILFHTGNYNEDSNGCILLGKQIGFINNKLGIIQSRDAFDVFTQAQFGINKFTLTVR